jgi:hypothetical protein
METNDFFEKQSLKHGKLFIIAMIVVFLGVLLLLFSLVMQLGFGKPLGSHTLSDTQYTIFCAIMMCILIPIPIMMYKSSLVTKINTSGISFRYFPFQNRYLVFPFSEIERCEVRQYDPMKEYGGWGVRYNFKTKEKAYNVSGNMGIQLYLKDGKKILIGTQKPDEAKTVLQKIFKS